MIWSVTDSEWVLEMAFVIKDQQFPGQLLLSSGSCFVDKIMHFLAVFWAGDVITILYFALCGVLMISPPSPFSLSSIHPTWRWVCDFFVFYHFIWGFLLLFSFSNPLRSFSTPSPRHVDRPPAPWLFLHSLLGCPTSRGLTWKWPIPACAKWPAETGSSPRATGRACWLNLPASRTSFLDQDTSETEGRCVCEELHGLLALWSLRTHSTFFDSFFLKSWMDAVVFTVENICTFFLHVIV